MSNSWTVAVWCLAAPLWATGVEAQGVSFTPSALSGIGAVAPRVALTWDERITSTGAAEFQAGLEESFDLGVLRAGVAVDQAKEENLWCIVHVVMHSSGLIVYSLRVELSRILYEGGGQPRAAITWKQDMLGMVGEMNLDPADFGRICAEAFERDWRMANPRGR